MAQVVVSASAIEKLERKLVEMDKDIATRQEKRVDLVKRIEAMKIVLGGLSRNGHKKSKKEDASPAPVVHQIRLGESMTISDSDGPSVPMVVKDLLGKKGRLGAVELRDALVAAGVPRERLGATYSYLYTVLGRLVQRGQIVRVRGKYQLPDGVTIQTKPNEEDFKGTTLEKK